MLALLWLLGSAVSCGWEDPLAGLVGPEHEVIKPKTRGFTAMTFNIYGARGLKTEADYDAIAGVIRYVNPDFVMLQEVDSCTRRQADLQCNSAAKLVEILDASTNYKWYYNYSPAEYNLYNQGGAYGDAILSRHEILWEKDYVLDYAPEHNDNPEKEKRSVNVIKVSLGSKEIYLGCTHFDHLGGEWSRVSQAEQLKEIVKEYDGKIFVLGGDLNAKPDSETLKIVTDYMIPSYTDEKQYTVPSKMSGEQPDKMIDYIMMADYSKDFLRCTSSNVLNHAASDHCAVYATYFFIE